MPIDPRELQRIRSGPREVLQVDRACAHCGYNLRGLTTSGRCPECGHPYGGHDKRINSNLTDAPRAYLLSLIMGLTIMAALAPVGAAVFLVISEPLVRAGVFGGAAMGWWFGMLITTKPRPRSDTILPDRVLDAPR